MGLQTYKQTDGLWHGTNLTILSLCVSLFLVMFQATVRGEDLKAYG